MLIFIYKILLLTSVDVQPCDAKCKNLRLGRGDAHAVDCNHNNLPKNQKTQVIGHLPHMSWSVFEDMTLTK